MTEDRVLVERFRRILLGLAVLLGIGTAVELATLRHWAEPVQLVPWALIVLALVATALVAFRRTATNVWFARLVGIVTALGAGFGVFEHVEANLEAGAYDATYAQTWGSMTTLHQVWLAATGGVGGTPPLAPGFLAVMGLCLALATFWLAKDRIMAADVHDTSHVPTEGRQPSPLG